MKSRYTKLNNSTPNDLEDASNTIQRTLGRTPHYNPLDKALVTKAELVERKTLII